METNLAQAISDNVPVRKHRRLWLWVVCAFVVMVVWIGYSFWSSMRDREAVLKFLDENHLRYLVRFQHPEWSTNFLDEGTYHPWFDEMVSIDATGIVATEEMLDDLLRFQELRKLSVRIENSPLEKFRQFESLEFLWLSSNLYVNYSLYSLLRPLDEVKSQHSVITGNDWEELISDLTVEEMTLSGLRLQGSPVANSHVKSLTLFQSEIENSFGDSIFGMNALARLWVSTSIVEPEFWKQIQNHPSLVDLRLSDFPITGTTWKRVCGIEGLQRLKVNCLVEPGLLPAGKLSVESLGPQIQPEGTFPAAADWTHIGNLKNLEEFSLEYVLISEELTRSLSSLPKLRSLSFKCVSLEDRGLRRLAGISTLESLKLDRTLVTASELNKFIESRPDVQVDHDLSDTRAKALIDAVP